MDWKKIETPHFLFLFPAELTTRAGELAGEMEALYNLEAGLFSPVRQSRWPVILSNREMDSMGYVSIPPRRSLWSTLPSGEDLPPLDWFDLLAIHEGRHMVQYDALNRRFNRVLYFLGGEAGLTAGLFWGIPGWYLEGDAVGTETAYTDSGRGRDPRFYRQMKAIVLDEDFSYQKMVNRSYRDYIPNEYVFGYFMTSYIKRVYGEDSWNRILDGPTLIPFPALGLYIGARDACGSSWSSMYRNMTEELKTLWEEQNLSIPLVKNRTLVGASEKGYVLWEPLYAGTDKLIARKLSLSEPAELLELTPRGERPLIRVPSDADIAVFRETAVWTYTRPSPLSGEENWSDLIRADLKTGEKTVLTRGKRYLSPSFSHDGREMAVVEWSPAGSSRLVILDSVDGREKEAFPLPADLFADSPVWSEDGEALFLVLQGREGRAIARIYRQDGRIGYLSDFSPETVRGLSQSGDWLFYSSNFSGVENVIALALEAGRKYQVSSRYLGARSALAGSWEGEDVIFYSDYLSIRGEGLSCQSLEQEEWIPEEEIRKTPFLYYPEDPDTFPDYRDVVLPVQNNYPVEDYSPLSGMVNIHSWGISPDSDNPAALDLYLRSDDVLDTFGWSLGAAVDVNETAPGAFLSMEWKGAPPAVSLTGRYWYREIGDDLYHDLSSSLILSLPLTFDRSLWYHRVTPYWGAGGDLLVSSETESIALTAFPLYCGIQGSSLLPGSSRSLNPLWGISWSSLYTHAPFQVSESFLFSSDMICYVPGGLRNTSLVLEGGYERQSGNYQSRIIFSRGYEAEKDEALYKYSASYEFPLFYPDLALGSWMYMNRIRGTLFYDHTALADSSFNYRPYRSLGGELNFDFNPFNTNQYPMTLGVRGSWLIEEQVLSIQLLFMTLGL